MILEQSSYSAMLKIAESVPLPEPVPSNSGNSIVVQYNRPTRHWSSSMNSREFHPIPESDGIPWIASNSGIRRNSVNCFQFRNQTKFQKSLPIPESDGIPRNSREFRVLSGDGIGRNCTEFRKSLPIPELDGIPEIRRNSVSDE